MDFLSRSLIRSLQAYKPSVTSDEKDSYANPTSLSVLVDEEMKKLATASVGHGKKASVKYLVPGSAQFALPFAKQSLAHFPSRLHELLAFGADLVA